MHEQYKVLLVEDSEEIVYLVKSALGQTFQVTHTTLAADALRILSEPIHDLVLIEVALPDSDGFRLCATLQSSDKTHDIPIIFLTGRSETADKVMGFSLGADDYIVKPFEAAELRARVEARLTKASYRRIRENSIFKGDLKINLATLKGYLRANREDKDLQLTPTEFRLLHYFSQNEGNVLTRSQLLNAIWGENLEVVDRTIDKHISSLRRKIVASHQCKIETVPSAGYRFNLASQAARPQ